MPDLVGQRFTVSTTRIALTPGDTDAAPREETLVANQDPTNTVSLGGPTVTAGTGFRLAPGAVVAVPLTAGEVLYAIRDGAADVGSRCCVPGSEKFGGGRRLERAQLEPVRCRALLARPEALGGVQGRRPVGHDALRRAGAGPLGAVAGRQPTAARMLLGGRRYGDQLGLQLSHRSRRGRRR